MIKPNNLVTVKVPGKLMLLGEHAVLYGCPCISTTINSFMSVSIGYSHSDQDEVDLKEDVSPKFIYSSLKVLRRVYEVSPIYISTESAISGKGLGSSAAVVVGVILAVLRLLEISLSEREIFDLCLEAVLDIQPQASGFDIATLLRGGTIYFSGKTKEIESLSHEKLPMFAVFAGSKGDTIANIATVKKLYDDNPTEISVCFEEIEDLVKKAKQYIQKKDYVSLGHVMRLNHSLLKTLTISTPRIDSLVDTALNLGAWGAKVSGAGGGDCLIVAADPKKTDEIKKGMAQHGGVVLNFGIGSAQGAKLSL
jgi:mevalonate kinase